MKLGRTSLIILVSGIITVAFISLGITHIKIANQQYQLGDELTIAHSRLDNLQLRQLYEEKIELEHKLTETQFELEAAKETFRQDIASITVTEAVFIIADNCSVYIDEISSPGIADDSYQDIACSVISLDITASGDLSNLIDYISMLNDNFTTGFIMSAVLSDINFPYVDVVGTARIHLIAYTYRGE